MIATPKGAIFNWRDLTVLQEAFEEAIEFQETKLRGMAGAEDFRSLRCESERLKGRFQRMNRMIEDAWMKRPVKKVRA